MRHFSDACQNYCQMAPSALASGLPNRMRTLQCSTKVKDNLSFIICKVGFWKQSPTNGTSYLENVNTTGVLNFSKGQTLPGVTRSQLVPVTQIVLQI